MVYKKDKLSYIGPSHILVGYVFLRTTYCYFIQLIFLSSENQSLIIYVLKAVDIDVIQNLVNGASKINCGLEPIPFRTTRAQCRDLRSPFLNMYWINVLRAVSFICNHQLNGQFAKSVQAHFKTNYNSFCTECKHVIGFVTTGVHHPVPFRAYRENRRSNITRVHSSR